MPFRTFVWLAVVLVAAGCDDGGAGTSTVFDSGLDPMRPLAGLSPQEADRLCNASRAWSKVQEDANRMLLCRLSAGTAAFLGWGSDPTLEMVRARCRETYDACLKREGIYAPENQTPPPMCSQPPASCAATVADTERCLNDRWMNVRGLTAYPTCDTLELEHGHIDNLFGNAFAVTLPPSCLALLQAGCTAP